MESNEILTSLAKLEASLKDVESAKSQVKQTVGAYASVQKQFTEYAGTLATIADSINRIMSDIRAQKASLNDEAISISDIIDTKAKEMLATQSETISTIFKTQQAALAAAKDSFSKECNSIADAFQKNTDAEIEKLKDNVESLKSCVSILNTLQENIKGTLAKIEAVKQDESTLKRVIMDSQGAQDGQLAQIITDIDAFASEQKQTLAVLKTEIISRQDDATKETRQAFLVFSNDLKSALVAHDGKLADLAKKIEGEHKAIKVLSIANLIFAVIVVVLLLVK